MSTYIPQHLRRWLQTLGERCEYCQTSEFVTGIVLEADHIWPRALHGSTTYENLCRACSSCNTQKGDQVEAIDPLTQQVVALFHPRQQRWSAHFVWSQDGTVILGITPYGRATVDALKLNNTRIVRSRSLWVSVGWHPPQV